MEAIKRLGFGKKKAMDMTRGSIAKNIIVFALPLLVGNLFQQLYNLVDTWVIGQTGNTAAFAAVGSVGQVINILIGFFLQPVQRRTECCLDLLIALAPLPEPHGINVGIADHHCLFHPFFPPQMRRRSAPTLI